jgi:hypothetical protein
VYREATVCPLPPLVDPCWLYTSATALLLTPGQALAGTQLMNSVREDGKNPGRGRGTGNSAKHSEFWHDADESRGARGMGKAK